MDVNPTAYLKKTKFLLVFFCIFLLVKCQKDRVITDVLVNYKNNKAVGISFNSNLDDDFSIHLKNKITPVLGAFSSNNKSKIFTPIIPFTKGEVYEIKVANIVVSNFSINKNDNEELPELLAIYPSTNVVPENMLKMYFMFSKPMQEVGKTLDFIKVLDKSTNKEVDVFLNLETELWNKNHTILTLWLDPGRIKKDLIPNKEKGLPILNGHDYILTVSKDFRDANANNLAEDFTKEFSVKAKDLINPKTEDWDLIIPKTKEDVLTIHFNESLDAILLPEVFSVYNSKNQVIEGSFQVLNNETSLVFKPFSNWEKGSYKIKIESKLEDLAGNNLNRLFDEDLLNKKVISKSLFKELEFSIE